MTTKVRHWPDAINLITGIWLIVSPLVLAFQPVGAPMWNSIIVGVLVAAIALNALLKASRWQRLINALLGLWLIASPWALSFDRLSIAMRNSVIAGVVVFVCALWARGREKSMEGNNLSAAH